LTDHDLTEFSEQRLTKALMRFRAEWQSGNLEGQSLVELFEVLVEYDRLMDGDSQTSHNLPQRFSPAGVGSLQDHRISILITMLHETQTRLRRRASILADRLETQAVTRLAQTSYGGVVSREYASPTPSAILCQS
jgi:hypothetical protein